MEQATIGMQKREHEISWKYTKMKLDIDTLADFETLANRREIRPGNLQKLIRLLREGKHFETPFMANKKGNKYRLLDGNHRLEAVKSYLEQFPQNSVEIGLCYYENLDEEREKEIFAKWNSGSKQSANDIVKLYWNDMPITQFLRKPDFPLNVTPYQGRNASTLHFGTLVKPYLAKDTPQIMFVGTSLDLVEKARQLGKADFKVMHQFVSEYIQVFGLPSNINPMYRGTNFAAVMRLWLNNYKNFTPEIMMKRLARLRGHERAIFWSTQANNFGSWEQCLKDFKQVVNRGMTTQVFV